MKPIAFSLFAGRLSLLLVAAAILAMPVSAQPYTPGPAPTFTVNSATVWVAPDGTPASRTALGLGETVNIFSSQWEDRDYNTQCGTYTYDSVQQTLVELWIDGALQQSLPYRTAVALVATTHGSCDVKFYYRDQGIYANDPDSIPDGASGTWDAVRTRSFTTIVPTDVVCTHYTKNGFAGWSEIAAWGNDDHERAGFRWIAHNQVQPASVCFAGATMYEAFNPTPLHQQAPIGLLYLDPADPGQPVHEIGRADISTMNTFADILGDPLRNKRCFSPTYEYNNPQANQLLFPTSGSWDFRWEYGDTLWGNVLINVTMYSDYNSAGGGRVMGYLGTESPYAGPWR